MTLLIPLGQDNASCRIAQKEDHSSGGEGEEADATGHKTHPLDTKPDPLSAHQREVTPEGAAQFSSNGTAPTQAKSSDLTQKSALVSLTSSDEPTRSSLAFLQKRKTIPLSPSNDEDVVESGRRESLESSYPKSGQDENLPGDRGHQLPKSIKATSLPSTATEMPPGLPQRGEERDQKPIPLCEEGGIYSSRPPPLPNFQPASTLIPEALYVRPHNAEKADVIKLCQESKCHSSSESKKRARTCFQRRTVSESHYSQAELDNLRERCKKTRHSFCTYEICDNSVAVEDKPPFLKDILDRTEVEEGPPPSARTAMPDLVLACPDSQSFDQNHSFLNGNLECEIDQDLPSEPVARKGNLVIPETLLNKAKKSMIEEYKKLKKKNSNLSSETSFYHSQAKPFDKPREAFIEVSSAGESGRLPISAKEAPHAVISDWFLPQDQAFLASQSSNVIQVSDTQRVTNQSAAVDCRSNQNRIISLESLFAEDFMARTTPVSEGAAEGQQTPYDTSSPPGRLETWKNLLAEKKSSSAKNSPLVLTQCDVIPKIDVVPEMDFSPIGDTVSRSISSQDDAPALKSDPVNAKTHDKSTCLDLEHFSPVQPLEIEVVYKSKEALLVHSSPPCEEESHSSKYPSFASSSCESAVTMKDVSSPSNLCRANRKNNVEQKHKIKEACHGIANALRSLPAVDESPENGASQEQEPASPSELSPPKDLLDEPEGKDRVAHQNRGETCPKVEGESSCYSSPSSSDDSDDYCQTDECGDDCDYCSGEDAEDEDEGEWEGDDICQLCQRNRSFDFDCKHTRVMTNGSLKPLKRRKTLQVPNGGQKGSSVRSLALQGALRRRRINKNELCAIREYSNTSDERQPSEEELSHDDSMCDLSSSWRFGLCREAELSRDSTMKSDKSASLPLPDGAALSAKVKSNSLPSSTQRCLYCPQEARRPGSVILKPPAAEDINASILGLFSGIKLPPLPPRFSKPKPCASNGEVPFTPPRPAMGIQSLQQRPPSSRYSNSHLMATGPKTVVPRSPTNPNPPFGYPSPPSPPGLCPASPGHVEGPSEAAPASPRTNCRSGALVSRNFSISEDEGGQRIARRQVTITRHEAAHKEAADRGCLLLSSSAAVDPYWISWKLGVLLKTVEEVGSRLEEADKALSALGPFPQDSNLADQYAQNIRKFRERLPDLQRGVDDVNDQVARFSAHSVSLTPANSAAINDINNKWKSLETTANDRWRQAAGRSREATPLTPAQLATSVSPPWERATATNKVPYYINHAQETTHWDHPEMMDLLDSLSEFNHIKFSAYRTASKLRMLQKKLALDRAKLQMVTDVFDEHGLRGQNDRLIDVNDMVVVLSTLYGRITSDHPEMNTAISTDLCLNLLLNVYDSQRTGQMRVLSFRVGLICLCRGHLEEKYRYMFRLIADPNRLVDQRKLGLLLHDCVQVPRQLGEVAAFGGSNIEPSVRSCFTKAGKDRESIEAVHFLAWVQQEPQSLVWLAVLHRVAASESVLHQVKCNICKTCPIVGLRYRCLKCLSFDMCQRCFFDGRSGKSHKITHPMHEYCTATTAGDEMKDFTKALKNKFKSKRSLQKHTKKGYLPVQTVLEGDALESPSPSPSHVSSHEVMHSRLELYASRLAEVELRTNSNSTPDSEDEHGLIAQYCQSLTSSDAPFPVPKSPLQIMASVDADQKDELEQMIRDLEEENRCLQAEYEHLKSQQPSGVILDDSLLQRSEAEMLAEAKLLREHKGRLEARMTILEDHNRQLEAQLQRLRHLLQEQTGVGSPNKSGTLQTKSVTASQLAMDSPAKINGHSTQGDLEKAVGHLVASMNRETENGLPSDKSDEEDYDNTSSGGGAPHRVKAQPDH